MTEWRRPSGDRRISARVEPGMALHRESLGRGGDAPWRAGRDAGRGRGGKMRRIDEFKLFHAWAIPFLRSFIFSQMPSAAAAIAKGAQQTESAGCGARRGARRGRLGSNRHDLSNSIQMKVKRTDFDADEIKADPVIQAGGLSAADSSASRRGALPGGGSAPFLGGSESKISISPAAVPATLLPSPGARVGPEACRCSSGTRQTRRRPPARCAACR